MTVILFGCLAGFLLGAVNVAVRLGMTCFDDAELGGFVMAVVAMLVLSVIVAASGAASAGIDVGELWPFFLTGMLVPGASQILWVRAVRDAGPSRAAIAMGIAPVFSVLIAVAALGEPFRPPLAIGTLAIVAGGAALLWERVRPSEFKQIGLVLAVAGAVMQAGRDNAVRGLSQESGAEPLLAAAAMVAGAVLLLFGYVLVTRRRQLRFLTTARATLPFLPAGVLMALIYVSFLEGLESGPVTVFAPLAGTGALWTVVLAALLIGRREAIGRHLLLTALLVVAGGALIGIFR